MAAQIFAPLFTALKSFPWARFAQSEVLSEVASSLVRKASRRQEPPSTAEASAHVTPAETESPLERAVAIANVRMQSLEVLVSQLQSESLSATRLLESVVQEGSSLKLAVQVLRARTQVLSVMCAILAVAAIAGWFFPLVTRVA